MCIQKVRVDRTQQQWNSPDQVHTSAVSLVHCEDRYHSFNYLLLCVIVLHQFKMNNLIENPAGCEVLVVI